MSNLYWIYADITGVKKWHLVYDKRPGMYFVQEDFEEKEYDIFTYREDFPHNEVVEIPNIHEVKNPLGICDDHKKIWNRMDCPLCDFLFCYDRLDLAINQMGLMLFDLEIENVKVVKKRLKNFLNYARMGHRGSCTCDEAGENRCSKHGFSILADNCRNNKEK